MWDSELRICEQSHDEALMDLEVEKEDLEATQKQLRNIEEKKDESDAESLLLLEKNMAQRNEILGFKDMIRKLKRGEIRIEDIGEPAHDGSTVGGEFWAFKFRRRLRC
jgi:hypothetical protein